MGPFMGPFLFLALEKGVVKITSAVGKWLAPF